MMMIIISFRRRVGFFTMRDKWRRCVAANVPLWKKQSIFFPFFMEERCNFEGTRLFVSYFIAEWMYVCFFEIRDYLWLMTRISCEDKWQLDWIVFFLCDFSWNGTREIFFFLIGGILYWTQKRSSRESRRDIVEWNFLESFYYCQSWGYIIFRRVYLRFRLNGNWYSMWFDKIVVVVQPVCRLSEIE